MRGAAVVIVGAGPVGLTLAVLLGQHGHTVEVLEKQAAPYPLPRAVHLDHQAARILDAAGVMEALAPGTEAMGTYEWWDASGSVLLRLGGNGGLARSGWPESSMFCQPELERLLAERAASLPAVTVRRGVDVKNLSFPEAAWVVGCDGSDSTVRRLAGIELADRGFAYDWLVIDVVPDDPGPWHQLNVQVCDPARPTTVVSGGPGRRRFELMALPGEDLGALATEAQAWQLLAPWGLTPANAKMERHAVYRFGAARAERWRDGQVLLAGDAAHQMPPFAGQGLCSGLRDAANLAWKLDLVLQGMAAASLVGTYQTERAPQVDMEIDFSVALGEIVCVTDQAQAAARDQAMLASGADPIEAPPPPPLGPGALLQGDPWAGHLSPELRTGDGDQAVGAGQVVRNGWALYGRDRSPGPDLAPGTSAWLAKVGGRSAHVPAAADMDGTYRAWFDQCGAAVVLVRPDFAIYGTAPDHAGADALVCSARKAMGLGGPTTGPAPRRPARVRTERRR